MYRSMLTKLKAWKESSARKPLILQGVRQVGKTYVLKAFGEQYYEHTAYFNFEENRALEDFFKGSIDPERIIQGLSVLAGKAINKGTTLIIFDEIQESNQALNSLKYFCETANDYHIVCAGSLLGITLSKPSSFPVGKVNFLMLRPVSFQEFLLANNEEQILDYVTGLSVIAPIPEPIMNCLSDSLLTYLMTGGMPEPLSIWLNTKDVEKVQQAQQEVLNAYLLDFAKHALTYDIPKLRLIWNSIPTQLARENGKFIYSAVKPGARAREYENALSWLENAGMVHKIFRTVKPAFPLNSNDDLGYFKLYVQDVGLLRCMANLPPQLFMLKNSQFAEFKGVLAENFVLQELLYLQDYYPRYWSSGNTAEVDFVFQWLDQIYPLEVKASTNVRSQSLGVYRQKYLPQTAVRTSMQNLTIDAGLLNVPLSLLWNLPKFLSLGLAQK